MKHSFCVLAVALLAMEMATAVNPGAPQQF